MYVKRRPHLAPEYRKSRRGPLMLLTEKQLDVIRAENVSSEI